ncbi:IS66 family transposase [Bradyrhizobium elkanii]|uniref:IS66 family transposase n=1 Tax=Bradyrhizobium elkanii TaxID=29448 RepID=UPI001BAB9E4B|nr:IS66 family transposase [Bradyrhizobium elkanii]MBR1162822.1 IS66 family transposase [Bradyrhizobium elkanii]
MNARDQRSWAGPAGYVFAPDRKAEGPAAHLTHFKGVLHIDRYAGFDRLTDAGNIILACWAHTGRKFYEVAQPEDTPVAHEALRRIASLYAVEAQLRGQSPAHRLAARRGFAKPIVDSLRPWLEVQLPQLPGRRNLGEAIGYALSRWVGLTRFLPDGCIELDTNPVDRTIRPVAFGRKNNLFAGSDGGRERWAILCSLIETCKLNDVGLYTYLRDVLQRMVDGHPINRLDELLPWNRSSAGPAAGNA